MAISRKKLVNIHSSVENKQPSASALEYGEIAVNYAPDKEFLSFKNANDDVVRVSTDDIQNKRMESKEVVPISGSITNVDKASNKSELVIKLNQWVGEGTPSAHELNYGLDSKGVDIAPGFAVDMSAFALDGGNGNFETISSKCSSTLAGTTKITGPDASHASCGNKLEVSTTDTSISGDRLSISNNSGITISNKSTFEISGNTLNVKETNFNITGTSTFNGNATINGNATVTGNTTLKAASMTNASVSGTLNVTGNTILGNASVGGTLGIAGNTTLSNANLTGTLGVSGNTTVNGATTLKNTTVNGTLNVTGATTLANATVNGTATLKNTTVNGTLNVTGATTLANATVGGNLTANGNTTLKATTMDSASVKGGLTVSGASSLNSVSVSGASTLNTLTVNGASTMKAVTVNGNLNTTGTNNLSGTTMVQSGSSMVNILDLIGNVDVKATNGTLSSATFTTTSTVTGSENGQLLTIKQKNGTEIASGIRFDNALNATSVNAVQNKVVYNAYEELDCGKIDTTGLTGDNIISVAAASCRTAQLSHKTGANAYAGDKLTVIQTDAYGHIIGLREATDADITATSAQLQNLNIMYGATTASTTGSFTRDTYTPYNGGTAKNLVVPQKVDDLEGGSTVKSDITALKSDVSTAKSDITTIKGNVSTISGSVGTLSTNITNLSNKVDTVSGNVSTVSGNVTTLSNSLNSLTQTVNNIQTTTNSLDKVKPNLQVISVSEDTPNQQAPTLADGQDAVVIYKNTNETNKVVVSIASGLYVTPTGEDLTFTIPVNGYCEVNYLKIGGDIFARGA